MWTDEDLDECNGKRRMTSGLRFSISVDAEMSLDALQEKFDYSDGYHHSWKKDLA